MMIKVKYRFMLAAFVTGCFLIVLNISFYNSIFALRRSRFNRIDCVKFSKVSPKFLSIALDSSMLPDGLKYFNVS